VRPRRAGERAHDIGCFAEYAQAVKGCGDESRQGADVFTSCDFAALLRSGENSLLSERGRVTIDERTNTLLVLETREKLADIRALVQRLESEMGGAR